MVYDSKALFGITNEERMLLDSIDHDRQGCRTLAEQIHQHINKYSSHSESVGGPKKLDEIIILKLDNILKILLRMINEDKKLEYDVKQLEQIINRFYTQIKEKRDITFEEEAIYKESQMIERLLRRGIISIKIAKGIMTGDPLAKPLTKGLGFKDVDIVVLGIVHDMDRIKANIGAAWDFGQKLLDIEKKAFK